MVYKCCAPGCRTGYRNEPRKSDITVHKFPSTPTILRQWLQRIPRQDFTPTSSSRICSLHFVPSDFVNESCDRNPHRIKKELIKRRLTSSAIPSRFPNLPQYLSSDSTERPTMSADSDRRMELDNKRLSSVIDEFKNSDNIDGKQELLRQYSCTQDKPENFIHFTRGQSDFFIIISTADKPHVVVSVEVRDDMSFTVISNDVELDRSTYGSVMQCSEKIAYFSDFINLLAYVKSFEGTKKNDVEVLQVLSKRLIEFSAEADMAVSSVLCKRLVFLGEQLALCLQESKKRRYSNTLYVASFLWYACSPSCYKSIQESGLLVLPSIRSLQRLSACIPSKEGLTIDKYLNLRSSKLNSQERYVSLIFDEVYIAQRIEFDGRILGLLEDLKSAKTILCFMIQSLSSKFRFR